MSLPADQSVPTLATGCRWATAEADDDHEERTVLFPEGAIKVQGPGRRILEECDGKRTFLEIVSTLERQYNVAEAGRIRSDAANFLEQLHDKRIVDY